jgi:hypothetical protein
MTLNDLYLTSRAAAAVIGAPTLVFLAMQVRQNTKRLRANAIHQFLKTNKDLNIATPANKAAASDDVGGTRDFDALQECERRQFGPWTGQYHQAFSNMRRFWKSGAIPRSAWRPVRKHLIDMLGTPGARHAWDMFARQALLPDFSAFGDKLAASGEMTYSLQGGLAGPAGKARNPS